MEPLDLDQQEQNTQEAEENNSELTLSLNWFDNASATGGSAGLGIAGPLELVLNLPPRAPINIQNGPTPLLLGLEVNVQHEEPIFQGPDMA